MQGYELEEQLVFREIRNHKIQKPINNRSVVWDLVFENWDLFVPCFLEIEILRPVLSRKSESLQRTAYGLKSG